MAGINVGLWFDLRNPPQWRRDPTELYRSTLDLCEEMDELGVHSLWCSEHHLFDDDYMTQPLAFCAALAARTRQARLGTAICAAPFRNAATIAEEAALIDIISGGRLELGLGAGYRPEEFELFGADLKTRYGRTDETVREVRELWDGGRLTPAPVQERPRIWLGYQGPQGARRAGRLGESLLTANPKSVEPYLEGRAEAGLSGEPAPMWGGINAWVSEDPEHDWPLVAQGISYQFTSYNDHWVRGTDSAPPPPADAEKFRARGIGAGFNNLLLATPEDAAAEIRHYFEGTPVETIFVFAGLPGMPHEMVRRHAHTLVTRLAPLLEQTSERE